MRHLIHPLEAAMEALGFKTHSDMAIDLGVDSQQLSRLFRGADKRIKLNIGKAFKNKLGLLDVAKQHHEFCNAVKDALKDTQKINLEELTHKTGLSRSFLEGRSDLIKIGRSFYLPKDSCYLVSEKPKGLNLSYVTYGDRVMEKDQILKPWQLYSVIALVTLYGAGVSYAMWFLA